MTALWKLLSAGSHPGLSDAAEYVRELRRYCTSASADSGNADLACVDLSNADLGKRDLGKAGTHAGEPDAAMLSSRRESGKSPPASGPGNAGETLGRIGIVGAGLMGCTIAALFLRCGHRVTLHEVQPEFLRTAPRRIAEDCRAAGSAEPEIEAVLDRFRLSERLADLRDCDLVLECVVEEEAVKRELLTRLEGLLTPAAVLASNTSGIPLARLAAGLTRPARFLGLHFLHPVRERPLVEVVRAPATGQEVLSAARDWIAGLGRLPLEVHDGPGFAVNRLLFPFLSEALQMLRHRWLPHELDAVIERCGWMAGPCKIIDEIGVDTTFRVGRVLWQAFPDRVAPSPILVTLLKRKRLGRKCGSGFYAYADTTAWTTPPQRDEYCDDWIRSWWEVEGESRPAGENVARRIILGMMLEGFRLLADGVVGDPRAVDAAAVFGLGFPERWGGPCRLARAVGESALLADLGELGSLSPFFIVNERTERVIRRVVLGSECGTV